MAKIIHGDMLEVLPTLDADSFDCCVTDPPYNLKSIMKRFGKPGSAPAKGAFSRTSRGFVGKQWDTDVAMKPDTWAAVLRVMKPGAHLVCFGGSRTSHRIACAIEDAGFEFRELLLWVYGTGMSHSHDVSKDLVKIGASPEDVEAWAGWGTHLKPAVEPIILARKPLADRTVARNVLAHGTGALDLGDCMAYPDNGYDEPDANGPGRALSNFAHDGSDEVNNILAGKQRLFYCAKPTGAERLKHPTQKPLALMDMLCRLVANPGGTILDPFAGSGSTVVAADRLGMRTTGIERDADYIEAIRRRLYDEAPLFAEV